MRRTPMSRRTVMRLMGGAVAMAAMTPTFASAQSGGTPAPSAEAIEHPTGATDVILRIAAVGGFVPVDISLSQLPQFTLFGDGTVITTGPMIEIFPAPALPNLRQIRLTEAGIQQVLTAARDAGLLDGDATYDNNTVTDLPTTVFTTNAGGKTTIVSAYALGFNPDPNWTAEESAAIAKLTEFAGLTFDVASWVDSANLASADEAFPVTRLQIVARQIDPSVATPEVEDPEMNQPPIEWPLSTSLADATPATDLVEGDDSMRCGVFEGEDAATVLAAAAQANVLTPWTSGESSYYLTFRPLLPDELGCPPQGNAIGATPVAAG